MQGKFGELREVGRETTNFSPEFSSSSVFTGESVALFLIEELSVVSSVPCSSESLSCEIMARDDVGAVHLVNDV